MTVRELIEKLQEYDGDAQVWRDDEENGPTPAEGISLMLDVFRGKYWEKDGVKGDALIA